MPIILYIPISRGKPLLHFTLILPFIKNGFEDAIENRSFPRKEPDKPFLRPKLIGQRKAFISMIWLIISWSIREMHSKTNKS